MPGFIFMVAAPGSIAGQPLPNGAAAPLIEARPIEEEEFEPITVQAQFVKRGYRV
jgi:hypothetical protein